MVGRTMEGIPFRFADLHFSPENPTDPSCPLIHSRGLCCSRDNMVDLKTGKRVEVVTKVHLLTRQPRAEQELGHEIEWSVIAW